MVCSLYRAELFAQRWWKPIEAKAGHYKEKRVKRALIAAGIAAMALAGSASAEWKIGADVNFYSYDFGGHSVPIGSFNTTTPSSNASYGGSFGFVSGPATTAWRPNFGFFGAQWDGPVEVSTITLNQFDDTAQFRPLPKTVYAYTSTTAAPIVIELPNNRTITQFDLTQFNGGKPILAENSYLMLAVQNYWSTGNTNIGILSYGFGAQAVGPADVNVNLGAAAALSPSRLNTYSATWMNDGMIATVPDSTQWAEWNNGAAFNSNAFWQRDEAAIVTMTYDDAVDIASIGLGLAAAGSNRDCPKWVTIEAKLENGKTISQPVPLNPNLTQYGRYDLDIPLFDVVQLKLIMPPDDAVGIANGGESANWKVNDTRNYGITEFQAFAPVPEPATMVLLVLGGLAMPRRR